MDYSGIIFNVKKKIRDEQINFKFLNITSKVKKNSKILKKT